MGTSDKVIFLKDFREEKEGAKGSLSNKKTKKSAKSSSVPVVEIGELREKIIADERRKVKRTLLTEFVGASVILPGSGLVRVTLNDISLGGLSFDVEKKFGSFKKGERVALRVYLNHTTFFPMEILITNSRELEDQEIFRHGSKFSQESQNHEALGHFINFMETVSPSLSHDLGDVMLNK